MNKIIVKISSANIIVIKIFELLSHRIEILIETMNNNNRFFRFYEKNI